MRDINRRRHWGGERCLKNIEQVGDDTAQEKERENESSYYPLEEITELEMREQMHQATVPM